MVVRMVSWKVFSSLALLCPAFSYAVCTYTWNTGDGTWSTSADWNKAGSGCNAYPGDTAMGITDLVIFNNAGAIISTTGVSPLNINALNFIPSNNFTISGLGTVTFVGTVPNITTLAGSQTISAPIALNLTPISNPLLIDLNTDLALSGGITDTSGGQTSSLTLVSGPGTLTNTNTISVGGDIDLFEGTFHNGAYVSAGGALNFIGANVTSNNSMTAPYSCNFPFLVGGTVDISAGTITLLSDSSCSPIGADVEFGTKIEATTGFLTMEGGTVSLTNNSVIDGPGPDGSEGVQFLGNGMTISGGTITATNNGAISMNAGNVGVNIWSFDASGLVPLTFSGGTVTAVNNGLVTSGVGVKINSGTAITSSPIIVSGGTVSVENTADLNGGTFLEFGATMSATSLTVTTGSLSFSNTGDLGSITPYPSFATFGAVSSLTMDGTANMTVFNGDPVTPNLSGSINDAGMGGGVGVVSSTTFTLSNTCSGTYLMQNTGTVNGGVGATTTVLGTTTLGGTAVFNNINSGNVTAGGSGGSYFSGAALNLAGATVNLTNSGAISGPSSLTAGSIISVSSITTTGSGSTLNMTNTGNVSGFAGNAGSYLVSTGGMLLGAGTWTAANNSPVMAGTGVLIVGQTNVTLGGTSINMSNNANLSGAGFGGQIIVGNTLGFLSGSSVLTLQNNNLLSGTVGAGVQATVQNTGAAAIATAVVEGTLNINNLGGVSATAEAGAQFTVTTNDFVQSGGTILLSNTGTISSTYSAGPLGAALTATGGTGNITLNGSFLMSNSGTVSAAGAGTAAGAAVIAAGNLSLGASTSVSNTGAVDGVRAIGSLCQGGALSFTMGSPATFTNMGIVSNSATNVGTLLLAKTGNITMSGTSIFTLNNAAAVSLGTGIELQAAAGSMFMNNGSVNITNNSAISGGFGAQLNIAAGNLTIQNSATGITLANTSSSTLTGGTGVLATVGNNFSITTGNLTLNNTSTLTGSASGAGMRVNGSTFSQTGGEISVINTAAFSGAGVASFITSAAPITIGGTGVFTLASSTPTTINSVDVIVTAPSVTINAGGTYQATGTTASNLINNGGTYVAGVADPSIGSHTITGNLTQISGDYDIVIGNFNNAAPSTNVSFTQVNGTVDWIGGTFNLLKGPGFSIPSPGKYAIWFLNSNNPITGDGSNLTINGLPGMSGIFYQTRGVTGNEGWLVFDFNLPVKPINPIPYQPITITTINFINTILGGELLRLQDRLATGGQADCATNKENCKVDRYGRMKCKKKKTAYNSAAAKIKGPAASQTISNPVFAASPQLGFINHQQQIQNEQIETYHRKADKPWDVYFGPLGDIGTVNNKHSQLGANYWYVGGLAGFDYAFSQVGVGLMVDYERVKAKLHKKGGHFDMNQFHATAYSTFVSESLPELAVNTAVGGGGAWFDIHRNVLSVKESTHAKTRGAIVDALLGMQYVFAHRQFDAIPCGLEFVPLINVQYIYEGVAGYREHGAGINDFKFHKQGFQSLRTTLGTWLQYTVSRDNFSFTPLFNIAWQREFLDHNSTVHATAIEVHEKEKIRTFGAGRNTLLTGLDLMFEFYNTYGIEASYEFEYNSLYRNNGFYLGFNVNF
jgi:hypothetical protein